MNVEASVVRHDPVPVDPERSDRLVDLEARLVKGLHGRPEGPVHLRQVAKRGHRPPDPGRGGIRVVVEVAIRALRPFPEPLSVL